MKKLVIGIDGNEANLPTRVGVGQYAYHTLNALYKLDSQNEYYIYLKSAPLADMPPARDNWHYVVFGPSKLWTRVALPLHLYLDGRKLDLFYSPGHYSPLFSPFPTIPTIHDLGYLDTPEQFTPKDFHQLTKWTEKSLSKASHVVAVSEFTKNELGRIYKLASDKVTVAFNGVNPLPKISDKDALSTLKKFNINSPYFLYLGTLKPNKNIPFLLKAFSKYLKQNASNSTKLSLVIAGKKGWLFDGIFDTVVKENLQEQVIFTDFINDDEKWQLYKKAEATILPSLYEGFGIPAIESQAAGTPVIASSIRAFREVVGNSAILIDPKDLNSLVLAMEEITKPEVRSKLIATGDANYKLYSWESSARSLLEAFNSI